MNTTDKRRIRPYACTARAQHPNQSKAIAHVNALRARGDGNAYS